MLPVMFLFFLGSKTLFDRPNYLLTILVCRVTGKSPYGVVFGQQPYSNIILLENLSAQGILNEEDIPDEIILTKDQSGSSVGFDDVDGNYENTAECESFVESNAETGKQGREYQLLDGDAVVAMG